MKAKQLAEILLRNPEAEVVHYQYNGCSDFIFNINKVTTYDKGEKTNKREDFGRTYVHKDCTFKQDVIVLSHDSNKP